MVRVRHCFCVWGGGGGRGCLINQGVSAVQHSCQQCEHWRYAEMLSRLGACVFVSVRGPGGMGGGGQPSSEQSAPGVPSQQTAERNDATAIVAVAPPPMPFHSLPLHQLSCRFSVNSYLCSAFRNVSLIKFNKRHTFRYIWVDKPHILPLLST